MIYLTHSYAQRSTQEVGEHSTNTNTTSAQCNCPEEPCHQEPATNEQEDRECIICMEEFTLGTKVSWSPRQGGCRHVYHKECIREWLLRHIGCPYCRQIMLPIDNGAGLRVTHRGMLRLLAEERTKRHQATHYCQTHGLVVRNVLEQNNNSNAHESSCKTIMTVRTSVTTTTQNDDDRDKELGDVLDEEEEDMFVAEPPLPKEDKAVRHAEIEMTFEPPVVSHSGDDDDFETDIEAAPAVEGSQVANHDEIEEVVPVCRHVEADIEAPVEPENGKVTCGEIEQGDLLGGSRGDFVRVETSVVKT